MRRQLCGKVRTNKTVKTCAECASSQLSQYSQSGNIRKLKEAPRGSSHKCHLENHQLHKKGKNKNRISVTDLM